MPTRRGWSLVAASAALMGAGRLLGLAELYVLAAAGVILVAAAVLYARLRPIPLSLRRRIDPSRAVVGSTAVVAVEVANQGRLTSPHLALADGSRWFRLASVPAGGSLSWSYRVEAIRRGLMSVGPGQIHLSDPFGVASRTGPRLEALTLLVHPRTEALSAPPPPPARPGSGAGSSSRGAELGDFAGLAPYQPGDDLRRVHWPTVARLDDLVVRLDDTPAPWHLVVVADLRAGTHDTETAEAAISAAASVARAGLEEGLMVRVLTTGGVDSGLAGGPGHLQAVLDLLALAQADRSDDLGGPARALGAHAQARTVVMVTGPGAVAADLAAAGAAVGPADRLNFVRITHPPTGQLPVPVPDGAAWALDYLEVCAGARLAPAWDARYASAGWVMAG
ncbi:MAG: DUF58 domain-containing protein [Acidimicrobiales bacterium]